MDGFLLVNKPISKSSFDVIRRLRKIVSIKKIGHSGTLDPLASGLLLVAIGRATKLLEYLVGARKEYCFELDFSKKSESFDLGDGVIEVNPQKKLSKDEIEARMEESFLGKIKQIPPKYSAIKVNGERAYKLAREGKEVKLKERQVEIFKFNLVDYNWPQVTFMAEVSSGTYIRSLGVDLAKSFGLDSLISKLKRTKVDKFALKDAIDIFDDSLSEQALFKKIEQNLLSPLDVFLEKHLIEVSKEEFLRLKNGQVVMLNKIEQKSSSLPFAATYGGKFAGVLKSKENGYKFEKLYLLED